MKNLFFVLFISYPALFFSQPIDLEKVVPSTASVVFRLNGAAITKKIGIENINNSPLFLAMAEDIIFFENKNKRISDIGIDLRHELIYFHNSTKKLSYSSFVYSIKNPKLFANYIAEKNSMTETKKLDGFTVMYYEHQREFLAWNDSYAVYTSVDLVHQWDEDVRDYVEELQDEIELVEIDNSVMVIDAVTEVVEVASDDVLEKNNKIEGVVEAAADAGTNEDYEITKKEREERLRKEQEIKQRREELKLKTIRGIYEKELGTLFNLTQDKASILNVKNYMQAKDETADFSFWVNINQVSDLFQYYRYGRYYGYSSGMVASYLKMYLGSQVNGHIFLKDEEVKFESNIAYSDGMVNWVSEIYNSKLSKKYLKYVGQGQILGISSFSFNSTKLWESFPTVFSNFIGYVDRGGLSETEREGISVLGDFFGIMLDEQALGDMITGDGVMVLKDLLPTKVEYKTHEYNKDYTEYKEVTKTRTEITPEFLMIFGTKNKDFMTRLLRWGCQNKVMYYHNNYYYTDGRLRDFPYQIYFTFQNDMAFVSSNLNEIQSISEGKKIEKPNKKIVTGMLKNSGYMMVNLKELLNKIPQEDMRPREKKALMYAQKNSESISYYSNFKNGKSIMNASIEVPSQFNNSALYIWDLIHKINEIERGH